MKFRDFLAEPEKYIPKPGAGKPEVVAHALGLRYAPLGSDGVFVFDAMPKSEVPAAVKAFNEVLVKKGWKNWNKPVRDDASFYRDPHAHQVYAFRFSRGDQNFDIVFRTKNTGQVSEAFLEALAESKTARDYMVETGQLDAIQKRYLGRDVRRRLASNPDLSAGIKAPSPAFAQHTLDYRIGCLLDAFADLRRKKFTPEQIRTGLKGISAYPIYSSPEDKIFAAVESSALDEESPEAK